MLVTPKKIEANRRNARRSTGPKTEQGKSIARWNALKHGLLCREVVIPVGEGQERESDFAALLGRLRDDLRPCGALEQMLVEKIAVCYWRLRRVLRCETGEIRKGLDTVSWHELQEQTHHLQLANAAVVAGSSRALSDLKDSSSGIHYLMQNLERAQKEVEQLGHLPKDTRRFLALYFTDFESSPPEATPQTIQEALEARKIELRNLRELILEKESLESESHRATLSLPDKEAMDRILRYEASIERQLQRAMSQLERLQNRRKAAWRKK